MASVADRPETAPRRSRARRWLLRLFITGAIFALLLTAIATVAYFYRADLLMAALERAAAPYQIDAGKTRFLGLHGIAFEDVAISAPNHTAPIASAKTVTTTFDVDGLRRLHIESIEIDGLSAALPTALFQAPTKTPGDSPPPPPPPAAGGLTLGRIAIADAKISAKLPDGTAISTVITYEGSDIRLAGSQLIAEDQTLTITNTEATLADKTTISVSEASTTIDFLPAPTLKTLTITGTATLPDALAPLDFTATAATLSPTSKIGSGTLSLDGSPIRNLTLNSFVTDWSLSSEAITLSNLDLPGGTFNYTYENTNTESPGTPPPSIPPIHIASGSAAIDITLKSLPEIGDVFTSAHLDLSHLTYQNGKASSPTKQGLRLSQTKIRFPKDLGTASLETASTLLKLTPDAQIPATLHDLTITEGRFATTPSPLEGRPALTGTLTATSTDDTTCTLSIANVTAATAKPETPPFAYIAKVDITLDPTTILDTHHVDSIAVSGAHTTISNHIVDYLAPPTVSPPPAAETAPSKPWTLGIFSISKSDAILSDILPGLPPLPFAINTQIKDLPLSREGLTTSEKSQQLTLSQVTLASKLNPLIPVIEFGELAVTFTLGGLVRQEIENVEVLRPALYIGEHLFWYVEFFQKQPTSPQSTPPSQASGWTVKNIEAIDGSLILAPKGRPTPGLRPLPFAGRTRFIDGQLSFDIADPNSPDSKLVSISIPKGDYPLNAFNLDLELDILGLSGEVDFNLPIGQNISNVVETLKADRIIFEQLELTDAYLSVTYNQDGVYAQFGGYAYGSYTKGAVNLYLDQNWSWDGWVTATGIEFSPLTTALTPTAVNMTGTADAEVIAQGDLATLDHLTMQAKLNSKTPGNIDILALAELVENLSPETPALTKQLAAVGLDMLQQFAYEKATIDISTSGYEGTALVELAGPSGLRKIEIESHDVRFRPPTISSTP